MLEYQKKDKSHYFLEYTLEFTDELEEILIYKLQHYYYDTALKFKIKLMEKISLLKNNPFLYKEYQENNKYRCLIVENYKVLYKIDLENQTVYLSHIYDSRRKYFNLK